MARPPSRHAVFDYRPPLALRLIRGGLMAVVALAVLSVAYTGYWFYVATAFRDGLPGWIERSLGPDATLSHRQLEISGYPFAFRLILHEPVLALAPLAVEPGDRSWLWRSSRIVATMSPWNFDRYTVDLAGGHEIVLSTGAERRTFRGAAEALTVRTELHDDGLPETVRLDLAGLRMAEEGASDGALAAGQAHVTATRLLPAADSEPSFVLQLQLANVMLPARLDLPLGHDVARLVAEATVMGRIADPTSPSALAEWRDAGGTVELTVPDGRYGPLGVTANGTMALDAAMQPMGAFTAKVEGLFPAIDRLRAADLIRSRDAAMAKVILGVLVRPGENGGPPSISLPFSIQDSRLYAGPAGLLDIPRIEWPAPRRGGLDRLR